MTNNTFRRYSFQETSTGREYFLRKRHSYKKFKYSRVHFRHYSGRLYHSFKYNYPLGWCPCKENKWASDFIFNRLLARMNIKHKEDTK